MPTTELEYTHESRCEECGYLIMGTGEPTDLTLHADTKEKHFPIAPTNHDCQFTEHYELGETAEE